MQQRFYLPSEYAEMLASKADGASVSPIIYLQHLITQDHICSGTLPQAPQQQPVGQLAAVAAPAKEDGPQLTGAWDAL